MMLTPDTSQTFAMPVFTPDDRVTYMGHHAVIVHGNEPAPDWGRNEPSATVNIRFDRAPRGWSPQQDVYATSLIRL